MARFKYNQERNYFEKIVSTIPKTSKVLEVGCGFGRNMTFLQALGFQDVTGIDISEKIISENKKGGLNCLHIDDFNFQVKNYDVILFSHIIEHFQYEALNSFLEKYLNCLKDGGLAIFITPLLQQSFYNDFDHVKPYYPIGLEMLYGEGNDQIQFKSNCTLRLKDLFFYKDQLRLRFYRDLYVKNNSIPRIINMFLRLTFVLTFGLLGEKIGWIGMYEKNTRA
jgi:SAM-dependent methyltransferase